MAWLINGFRWMVVPEALSIPASMEIEVSKDRMVPYSLLPLNSTNQKIRWSSADTSIATIDENWIISWVSAWETTITWIVDTNWIAESLTLTVTVVNVTWVTLNESSIEVSAWESFQLTATVTPSDASNQNVTWSSSNTSVAVVDWNWLVTYVWEWNATITCTTVDGWYTDSCTVICEDKKPVSQTFSYTWSDQSYTIPYTQCYKLEAWWAWSWDAKWWYASWVMCMTKWTVLRIMVGSKGNNDWTRYWFGWTSNYNTCYYWWWLSWVFTGDTAITATDSARALVIWWWAWSYWGRWNGWAWGWECWANWWTSWYWTAWWGWTQTWRQSWWNVWWAQFCWGNGGWTFWSWWGWWWYWWNGSAWDSSAFDDRWAWGWSWYVKSTMESRTLTQWWWSAAQTHWSVKISSV